jgi:alkylation response protein AidB-like acyl-CoA dehydrogenase
MPPATASASPLAPIQDALPILRQNADAGEAGRRLTDEAHRALVAAGVFDLWRPRALGGEEADIMALNRAVVEAARADGSSGWCAMISGVYAAFGGMLPAQGAAEVFAPGTTVIAGGLGPAGAAVEVDGGYRVSGRWTFGSNSPHANWFVGGCVVIRDGQPVMVAPNVPRMIEAFFPRESVTFIDTWQTTGLRGTASQDYACEDVFVPLERTFWFADKPSLPGTLYQMPLIAVFGTTIASVSVGIALHALDIVRNVAPGKRPILSGATMQEKANVQDRVGRCLANVNAARAYLDSAVMEAWDHALAGGSFGWVESGRLWLAATHAAQLSLEAVNEIYTVTGATSVYTANELDRCLRDIRTATQHVMTQYVNYETAGKQFLGLPVHDTIWAIDHRE